MFQSVMSIELAVHMFNCLILNNEPVFITNAQSTFQSISLTLSGRNINVETRNPE
jgi:hypothetical protein